MHKLVLRIYSFEISIEGDDEKIIQSIKKDFSFFEKTQTLATRKKLKLNFFRVSHPSEYLPKNLIAKKQSQNSITYDLGEIRYNDYYGKVVTKLDYESEYCEVFYSCAEKVHEVIYLIILSRSGKHMDLQGFHKIHACAVSNKHKNIVYMMPSKGGKTTMFNSLVADPEINIISDDTPIVDQYGQLHPFPLRIGHDSLDELVRIFPYLKQENISEFKRDYFSTKYLVDVTNLKNDIKVADKTVLVVGKRSTFDTPQLVDCSKVLMFKQLIEHMIIGIGLPMIVEYFVRTNIKDHFSNIWIFIKRVQAAILLVARSDCYFIYSSTNKTENTKVIMRLLNEE